MAFLDFITGQNRSIQDAGKQAAQQIVSASQHTLYWTGFIGFILLGLALCGFIFYYFTFKLPIILGEIIGGNNEFREIRKGKGKIVKKEGIERLKVFGIKGYIKPPNQDEYSMKNGKKTLYLIKSAGSWVPYKIVGSQIGSIAVNDADIRQWAAMEMKSTAKKYTEQTFMQRYGSYVMFVFGLIVLGWMYWVFAKMFNANLTAQLNAQSQITEKFGEVAKIMGEKLKPP